jgi:hypothetical protein
MRNPKLLLVFALLATGIVRAQTPAQSTPTRTPDIAQPLPVPGGGAGLGPGGIPKAEDQHTPTLEEARQKAKAQSDQIADLQARRLAQQLNLDSAQLNRVRTIFIEREDELRKTVSPETAANDSHPLTPEERQLEIQQIKDGAIRKLQVVLTPEQKQQFDAMIAHSRAENARRSAMSRRMRPPISGTAPAAGTTPAAPAAAPAPAAPPQ